MNRAEVRPSPPSSEGPRALPEVLENVDVFGALAPDERAALAVCLVPRRFSEGEVVFREGEPGATLLVIVEGAFVAATRKPDGRDKVLREMGPFELVGEMAFLDPCPRSATVRAKSAGVAYELNHDSMDVLRKRAPAAADALVTAAIRDVTRRLRSLDEAIGQELERLGAKTHDEAGR